MVCVFLEFVGVFQGGLGSEWDKKLYGKSESEVGKGAQGLHTDIRKADIPSHGNV